jgi:hypothetical protein
MVRSLEPLEVLKNQVLKKCRNQLAESASCHPTGLGSG